MTSYAIDRACRGGRDVVKADPKKKRKLRDSFSAAEKYADDWFSAYIKARDKRCVTAGMRNGPCSTVLQCSHVERRGHKMTRYLPGNAMAQCKSCHIYHHTQSESNLRTVAERKFGHAVMQIIYEDAQKIIKRTPQELREIGNYFKRLVEEMEE
jgi:hypothetical protein